MKSYTVCMKIKTTTLSSGNIAYTLVNSTLFEFLITVCIDKCFYCGHVLLKYGTHTVLREGYGFPAMITGIHTYRCI